MKKGDVGYCTVRELWGHTTLGNPRLSYNKKVRILEVNPDGKTCSVELLSGFLEEIGSIVHDVRLETLVPSVAVKAGKMPFYPDKNTVLLGPIETGGYADKEVNLSVLSGMASVLLLRGLVVFAPQVYYHHLASTQDPLFGRQDHLSWEPFLSHIIRHAEQVLVFTPINWGDSLELDRLLTGMVSKRFTDFFRVFTIDENFSINALSGDKHVSAKF